MAEPDDNNLKVHELLARQGRDSAKGISAGKLIDNIMKVAGQTSPSDPWKDMPMITLKHRWMRNRNLVAGVTTFSFDGEGIAKVRDVGNARLDVEQLVKHSKGLVTVVDTEAPKAAEPAAKAPVVPDPPAEPPKKAEAPEPTVEVVEDEEPTKVDKKTEAKKKVPPKKKKS